MSAPVRIGLAGYGYWGPNLLRNFRVIEECRLVAVAEERPDRAALATRHAPDVQIFHSADDMIAREDIDAVVLALPGKLLAHYGRLAIEEGKHVLLEKPMALSLKEGREVVSAADRAGLVAMVDYTFVYSPAIRRMREIVVSGRVGTPIYYQSTRLALGPFRTDLDVVWDNVCHDIAIMEFVLGRRALNVHGVGRARAGATVDTVHMTVTYEGGFHLFAHASWMAPKKVRTGILAGDQGMVLFDDIEPDEKVRHYLVEQRWDPLAENSVAPTYRMGDVHSPHLESIEPLQVVAANFVRSALGLEVPDTDARFGLRVLAVLEAATAAVSSGRVAEVEAV